MTTTVTTAVIAAFAALLAGLLAGFAAGWFAARQRLGTALDYERAGARTLATVAAEGRAALADSFQALAGQALERNNRQFLELATLTLQQAGNRVVADAEGRRQAVEQLVSPLRDTLTRLEAQLRGLEIARGQAYAALTEQVRTAADTSERLRAETAALVTALRRPEARGRWGEMQLRRVVEVAGMAEHCDFDEQVPWPGADGAQRPDLVVHLAGNRHVVVDAKVALTAYLDAAQTDDPAVRADRLSAHARQLRTHVDQLGAKAYWERTNSPEFVVLFIPGEVFLAPALEADPDLLEHAASKRVVLATPTTLIALLRTVAYAWQQERLSQNAAAVFELGRELYSRLGTMGGHLDRLGRGLARAVTEFNSTVGSLEGRVLPSARRLASFGIVDTTLDPPGLVEALPRPLAAPELTGQARTEPAGRALTEPTGEPDPPP